MTGSAHTRGGQIVQEIRQKVQGYDIALDQWDPPPSAAELTAALAQYPTESTHKMQELEGKARPYLQTRAYVQANVEHAHAMERLAERLDLARQTGRLLVWVGIGLGAIEVLVAIAGTF